MISQKLFQPIFSRTPEPGHKDKALNFERFINLLKEEEAYYSGEEYDTMLMITRLRKIFYDSWGWNSQVIRGAAKIPGRYQCKMDRCSEPQSSNIKRRYTHNQKLEVVPLAYKVTYTKHDKVYPERAGQTPEIYTDDHQEVLAPDGCYCDVGHILSGIDAYNYFAPVTPMPNFLIFIRFLFPYVKSNLDFATWLGDVASTSGDFLLYKLCNKSICKEKEQEIIDKDAPGSDMVGNIYAYVIKELFNTKSRNGLKVTEILKAYFEDLMLIKDYQARQILIFCQDIGLKNWNGSQFSNEKKWLKAYKRQLRSATIFYVFGEVGKLRGVWLAIKIWFRLYEKALKLGCLLQIFLDELKKQIIVEQKNQS
jgi:hypothetical protein